MDMDGQTRSGSMGEGYKPIRQTRRYRFNAKKFARSILLLGCLIAVIVIIVCFAGNPVPAVAQAASSVQPVSSVQAASSVQETQIPVSAEVSPSAVGAAAAGTAAQKVAVVDAGHGGFDIGATGVSGVHESDLNLKVAGYLKADLEQEGVRVIMTRSDENAIAATKDEDMAKRREIIQQSGSDIVVSIHMNADTDASISGPVVLFSPGAIQGEKLAKMIQYSLLDELKPDSKNIARTGILYVLENNTQPSVLVECGFITNAQEEALLVQEDYQKKVAYAITQGCMEFLQS